MARRRRRPASVAEVPGPWIYKIHDPSLPLGSYSDERLPGGDNRSTGRRSNVGRFWTKPEIMAAFDTLPRIVRTALANAQQPWAPHWAERACLRRFPPAAIIERLERADRDEALCRELQLLAGKG